MEKSEGRKQGSSPGSSSRRAYSLFSSIINLSSASGVKTTDGSSSQQSPNTIPITSTNHHQKQLSSNAPKKKKGNQSSSGSQSIGTPRTGLNGPMGPGPRTLSILTALSELANSNRAGAIDSNDAEDQEEKRSVGSSTSGSGKGRGDDNHQSNSNIYRRISSSNHQSAESGNLTPRVLHDLPTTSLGVSSMPRKLKGLDRNVRISASPSSSTSSGTRAKSKETTPDWIWRIFQLAKHGRLEELQKSLNGLEPLDPTLIRHLVDEKGNTLLHCAARRGHICTLQWLVSILGSQAEAVLNDRNRAGRNVTLTALKGGQLKCFQWLVLQSVFGDKALVPKEGERSLLLFAANYSNDPAVRWLAEQFTKRNVSIDLRDNGGMTPLHMAAKSGSVSVCHTLIAVAGADPFCQTELGWRPSDLAVRYRHMKCANYLMMAEAASSLGGELSSWITMYKKLHEEHELLRLHFREVLRVGKSLVKERVDLIKNFPSAGSKSSPEAELLLGGTSNNGARLSGLEHKLVRAEQAWKRMEHSQHDKFSVALTPVPTLGITGNGLETPPLDADFTVENINSHNLLQKRLAGLQSRQDKNLTSEALLLSASSSDTESTESSSSSAGNNDDQDDDRPLPDYHRPTRLQSSSSQQSFNPSDSSRTHTGTTAPWLLLPDDALLSALSPIVHQVDGAAMLIPTSSSAKEFIPSLDLIQKGPSSSNMSFSTAGAVGNNSSAPTNQSSKISQTSSKTGDDKEISEKIVKNPPSATVLEVIEPPNKSVYFTPDLIRGTRHKLGHNIKSEDPVWTSSASPTRSSSSINDTEDIYDQITAISGDQRSTFKSSVLKDASLTSSPAKAYKSWHHLSGGALPTSTSRISPSPTTTRQPNTNNPLHNSPRHSTPIPNSTILHPQHSSPHPENSFNSPAKLSTSSTNPCSKVTLDNIRRASTSKSSESSNIVMSPSTLEPSPEMRSKVVETFVFEDFSPDDNGESSIYPETEPSGLSAPLPSDSTLLSTTTTAIKRSLSSVSRVSATVEIPFHHKNTWASTEHLNFTTLDSSEGGRGSPAASESSRTESALIPPSHTSQISELSKTESATEPSLSVYNLDQTISSDELLEKEEQVDDPCQNDSGPECKMIFNESSFPSFTNNKYRAGECAKEGYDFTGPGNHAASAGAKALELPNKDKSLDEKKVDSVSRQDKIDLEGGRKHSASHSASGVSSKISAPCLTRAGASAGSYKGAIQRVTKPRGLTKPWYEVECSDEEGSQLLHIARTSRSCLSTSSFSTHSENESDTDVEHTCTADCTQNNCPDCV